MTEEAFVRTLQEKPDDDTTRLIYADWLEDQGDTQSRSKAAYIRADCELPTLPEKDRRRPAVAARRQALAETIEAAWLAVVSKAKIELCEFEFECPLTWESLRPVEGETAVRYCEKCKQNVYYSDTIQEAREHAWEGHCVAIDARVVREKNDLRVLGRYTVGIF